MERHQRSAFVSSDPPSLNGNAHHKDEATTEYNPGGAGSANTGTFSPHLNTKREDSQTLTIFLSEGCRRRIHFNVTAIPPQRHVNR